MSTPFNLFSHPPGLSEYAQAARRRTQRTWLQCLFLSLAMGFAFIAFGLDNLILPVVVVVMVVLPVLLWHYPRLFLYLTFAATCLFEQYPLYASDSITDRIPFFWNVNTIFEQYAHVNPKAMPMNFLELLAVIAGFFTLMRSIYTKSNVEMKRGSLYKFILGYIVFVSIGWVFGLATGGDFKISLMEVRAQFYLLLTYLLVVNTVNNRKQVLTIIWMMAVCLTVKGAMYTFRRYVTMAGLPLPDQGVGSHEEAFLFDAIMLFGLVLWLCGVHRRLQTFILLTLPLTILGNLATNRRAATAAFVIVVPVLILSTFVAIPRRRKMAAILGIILMVGGNAYYRAFKYSNSAIAQPARAIRSQFEPDQRDKQSNEYRTAENANLMYNIKQKPILGHGYGKHMQIVVPMEDISKVYAYWDIMPHNQVLWVWMRTGSLGFFAFWMMIAGILVHTSRTLRRTDLNMEAKALVLFGQITAIMLLIFGMFDMQLTIFRDMTFTGCWLGLATVAENPNISLFDAKADAPVVAKKRAFETA